MLRRLDCSVGGFYTREIRVDGRRLGFSLITLDGRRAVLSHVDLKGRTRVGRYWVDLSVLDGLAVDCIQQAVNTSDVVVIDQIGPMEMLSDGLTLA